MNLIAHANTVKLLDFLACSLYTENPACVQMTRKTGACEVYHRAFSGPEPCGTSAHIEGVRRPSRLGSKNNVIINNTLVRERGEVVGWHNKTFRVKVHVNCQSLTLEQAPPQGVLISNLCRLGIL